MPEIAEVETVKNDLLKTRDYLGHKIIKIEVFSSNILHDIASDDFINKLQGKVLKNITRIGKYLIFHFAGFYLIIHLKMTGHIFSKDQHYQKQNHDHVILTFENKKKLIYFDPRKFGRFYIKTNLSFLDKLGVDILSKEFQVNTFLNKLKNKNKKIKSLLLDQNIFAGLGNIYVNESLFLAKIHPAKASGHISKKKLTNLYHAIKYVIDKAIENRGTSLGKSKSNFSSINEDAGQNQENLLIHTKKNCPVCSKKINKIKINQRTTYFCPFCQKK